MWQRLLCKELGAPSDAMNFMGANGFCRHSIGIWFGHRKRLTVAAPQPRVIMSFENFVSGQASPTLVDAMNGSLSSVEQNNTDSTNKDCRCCSVV